MKRGILLVITIIMLLFIAGCTSNRLVCNKPYIQVGTECCLDKDGNDICDKDEIAATREQPAQVNKPAESTISVSEQPNIDKFNEYLFSASLGKLPIGSVVSATNRPTETRIFKKLTDQLCTDMEVKKTIPAGSLSSATYDVVSKSNIQPKVTFPRELITGGTSGCGDLNLPEGKYENKIYIDNILVAVLPFEVTS